MFQDYCVGEKEMTTTTYTIRLLLILVRGVLALIATNSAIPLKEKLELTAEFEQLVDEEIHDTQSRSYLREGQKHNG